MIVSEEEGFRRSTSEEGPVTGRCFRLSKSEEKQHARERLLARLGLGLAEHAVERAVAHVSERATERVAARLGERAAERVAERMAEQAIERSALGAAERLAEHGGEQAVRVITGGVSRPAAKTAVRRTVEKVSEEGIAASVQDASLSRSLLVLKAMQIVVALFGAAFVCHMVHSDVHRAQKERAKKSFSARAHSFFLIAAFFDSVDAFAHIAVLLNLTVISVQHELLHRLERLGLWAAIIATLALVIGEVLSSRHAAHGSALEVLPCWSSSSKED